MKVDGVSFNDNWIKGISEEDFLKEAEVNKDHWFPTEKNRKTKLKEVYALHNKKPVRKEPQE